jgi:hypothetical protein
MGRGPVQAHARHDIRRHSPYDHTGSTPDKEVDGRGLDTVENREMGSSGGVGGGFPRGGPVGRFCGFIRSSTVY